MKLSFRIIVIILLAVLAWAYFDLQKAIDEKDEEFRRRRLEREAAGEQTNLLQRPEVQAEENLTTNSQAKSSDSSPR